MVRYLLDQKQHLMAALTVKKPLVVNIIGSVRDQFTQIVHKGGIFQKGSSIYIKKAGEDGLISLNPDYPPLTADGDRITILGKVLGKAEED